MIVLWEKNLQYDKSQKMPAIRESLPMVQPSTSQPIGLALAEFPIRGIPGVARSMLKTLGGAIFA